MKKKILSGIFALALLVATGLGVQKSMKNDAGLSDLALSNVEALARNENDEKMVGYKCKNPNDGVGCGDIGQTGPACSVKRYC